MTSPFYAQALLRYCTVYGGVRHTMTSEFIDIKSLGISSGKNRIEFGFGEGILRFVLGALRYDLSDKEREVVEACIASYINSLWFWEKIGPIPIFPRRVNPSHIFDDRVTFASRSIVETAVKYKVPLLGSFGLSHQAEFCRGIERVCRAICDGEKINDQSVPKIPQENA